MIRFHATSLRRSRPQGSIAGCCKRPRHLTYQASAATTTADSASRWEDTASLRATTTTATTTVISTPATTRMLLFGGDDVGSLPLTSLATILRRPRYNTASFSTLTSRCHSIPPRQEWLLRPLSGSQKNFLVQLRYLSSHKNNNNNNQHPQYKKDDVDDDNHTKPPQPTPSESSTTTVWTQLQSLPNMITLARMASTPLLCYWIVDEQYTLAIVGCVVAALSDGLDGYLAKHYGGSTVLGTYLDPIADKVLINGLALSLWYGSGGDILPTPLIVLWAVKDVLLLSGTGWYLYQEHRTVNIMTSSMATKPLTVTPTLLAKINTGLQFTTLFIGIMTPVVSTTVLPPMILLSLCWVTGATTIGSAFSYTGRAGFQSLGTSTGSSSFSEATTSANQEESKNAKNDLDGSKKV